MRFYNAESTTAKMRQQRSSSAIWHAHFKLFSLATLWLLTQIMFPFCEAITL